MRTTHTQITQLREAFNRKKRKDPKFTKDELARLAGVHRTTIFDVFGEKKATSMEIIQKIAAALGLDLKVTAGRRNRAA